MRRLIRMLRGREFSDGVSCVAVLFGMLLSSCGGFGVINRTTRKPATTTVQVITPESGFAWQPVSQEQASTLFPYALDYDHESKTLYFTDIASHLVCMRREDGTIGVLPQSVSLDLSMPLAIDYIPPTTLIIADTGNKRICAITPEGVAQHLVTTEGRITGVVAVPGGAIYYSDFDACTVVKATAEGNKTVVAGTGSPGYSGDGGDGSKAALNGPYGLAWHGNRLYIADSLNHRIRVLDLESGKIDTFAGNGTRGADPPTSPVPGREVALNEPRGVTCDGKGNVYVFNTFGESILCFDPDGRFLPHAVDLEPSEGTQPVCGVVMEGELIYTQLVTPGVQKARIMFHSSQSPAVVAAAQQQEPSPGPTDQPSQPQPSPANQQESTPSTQETQVPAEKQPPPPQDLPQPVQTPQEPTPPPPPPGPEVTTCRLVGPQSATGQATATYTLVLDLAQGVEIGGVLAEVRFNPEHLRLRSVVPIEGATPNDRWTEVSQDQNSVLLAMHTRGSGSSLSGKVELCTLVFDCVWDTETPTVTTLILPTPTVIAKDGTPVECRAEDWRTTNFIYGDVNHDSKLDLVDGLFMLLNEERIPSNPMLLPADVDLDGLLTIADAWAVVRNITDNSPSLPTASPIDKAKWSDADQLLYHVLAGELTGREGAELVARAPETSEALCAEWADKLAQSGAALFLQGAEDVVPGQGERLVDVMVCLPKGRQLGAFDVSIEFDPDRLAIQKALIDEHGPSRIVGKSEIADGRANLAGVCRSSQEPATETVRVASLLVSASPCAGSTKWETTLRPLVRDMVDNHGAAMFAFGVPATLTSYRKGDVTRDGKVGDIDLLLVLESLSGSAEPADLGSSKAIDLDGDGRLTIRDAVFLHKLTEGEDPFDITTPSGRCMAVEGAIHRLMEREQRASGDSAPPSATLTSPRGALEECSFVRLDAPLFLDSEGYFIGTLQYQPRSGSSLGGCHIEIVTDPGILSIQSVLSADTIESIDHPLARSISPGQERLTLSQIFDLQEVEGDRPLMLASILFKLTTQDTAALTTTTIRFERCEAVDREGRPIPVIGLDHTVANFLLGDVNADHSVDAEDEKLISAVVTGELEQEFLLNPPAGDLNLDGRIDLMDAVLFQHTGTGQEGEEVIREARERAAILAIISRIESDEEYLE